MLVAVCPGCQTRYRVPDTAAGKRTRCKKCGADFRIAAQAPAAQRADKTPASPPKAAARTPAPAAVAAVFPDLDVLARGEAVDIPHVPPAAGDQDGGLASGLASAILVPSAVYAAAPAQAPERVRGAYLRYLAAVGRSLVFLRKPGNIVTFVVIWLVLAVRSVLDTASSLAPIYLVGSFLTMGSFVISGWYMAFRMNLVIWAAGEEEELPSLAVESGWWDDIVVPFFRMLATYIMAFLPMLLLLLVLLMRMRAAAAGNLGAILGGASPTPGPSAVLVLALMGLLGLLIWPMLVLTVACGGSFRAMFRLDLIFETVIRSLPAYLLTVLAVWTTFVGQLAITVFIWDRLSETTNWRDDVVVLFVLPTIFVGVGLYFDIVAMRATGYYYAHFKHKFAWSWG